MYLKYFFSQPPWMVCQSIMGLPPSIKLSVTHLYTWVKSAYYGDIEKVILKNTTGTKIPKSRVLCTSYDASTSPLRN